MQLAATIVKTARHARPAAAPWARRQCATLALLFTLVTAVPATAAGTPPDGLQGYDFGGVDGHALALYRRGWVEILEYGRWAEAERLYRETVALAPGFTVAVSVLARIVTDPVERNALHAQVRSQLDAVDGDALLLLHTYLRTLERFAMREAGEAMAPAARQAMAERAVRDYGNFLGKYPGEWSVMIEYIEWIHAVNGPAAALEEIARIRARRSDDVSFSYFPAWFHAELGHHDTARELAGAFARRIEDPRSPQPHYLEAFLAYSVGDHERAAAAIARALALDPRHLLAARLRCRIAAARVDEND